MTHSDLRVLAECVNATQHTLPIVVRPAGAEDGVLLAELLGALSPVSSFHRFMAGLGTPGPAFVRGLLRAEDARGALLAVVGDGAGEAAIGHACWSVTPEGVADVGVLVADEAQGRGIGTALFLVAVEAARDAGADVLHLDVHPENRRLVAALRRRLDGAQVVWENGLLAVDVPVSTLPLRSAAVAAA